MYPVSYVSRTYPVSRPVHVLGSRALSPLSLPGQPRSKTSEAGKTKPLTMVMMLG